MLAACLTQLRGFTGFTHQHSLPRHTHAVAFKCSRACIQLLVEGHKIALWQTLPGIALCPVGDTFPVTLRVHLAR